MSVNKNDVLAEMVKKLEALELENARLKTAVSKPGRITLRVSEKGALSAYGLGRFPQTLYVTQWERLLAEAEVIKVFIADHRAEFADGKDDPRYAEARARAGAALTTAMSKGVTL